MTPQSSAKTLETYFLEARSKILDLAAILDRVGRGKDQAAAADPRLQKIAQALAVLGDKAQARAERIQQVFSLEYDPEWKRPTPRG